VRLFLTYARVLARYHRHRGLYLERLGEKRLGGYSMRNPVVRQHRRHFAHATGRNHLVSPRQLTEAGQAKDQVLMADQMRQATLAVDQRGSKEQRVENVEGVIADENDPPPLPQQRAAARSENQNDQIPRKLPRPRHRPRK
jgi:hypothetical protein